MTNLPHDALVRFLDRLECETTDGLSSTELLQATVSGSIEMFEADVCIIAEKANGGLVPVFSQPTDWTDTDGLLAPASLPSVIASRGISYLIADRSDVRGATVPSSLPEATSTTIKSVLVVPFGEERVLIAGNHEASTFTEADLENLNLVSRVATILKKQSEALSTKDHAQDHVTEAGATLSHDGKNFLSIIQGRAQLAREDPQAEHFDAIERASQRMDELIEDTRTLLETGTQATDIEAVPLRVAVEEAWEVEQTDEAEFWMTHLETILAERSRVCQMLENLFRNSVEHAGPAVTITVGMLSEDQGFYVEDDGPGIDPREEDSVLEFAYAEEGNRDSV